jgi:hypothetical protein
MIRKTWALVLVWAGARKPTIWSDPFFMADGRTIEEAS